MANCKVIACECQLDLTAKMEKEELLTQVSRIVRGAWVITSPESMIFILLRVHPSTSTFHLMTSE